MMQYEYKVVPAPAKGEKAKGLRSTEDRFAQALSSLMNRMGRDGWEYQRADTLPCEERQGLTGKTTRFQNMLIFRRPLAEAVPAQASDSVADTPQTPDQIAASAAATLSAAAPEGATPSIRPVAEGGA
ncbi:MAG: DUF4177 domain-containing protein, partial [Paracoccaceae bacterium]